MPPIAELRAARLANQGPGLLVPPIRSVRSLRAARKAQEAQVSADTAFRSSFAADTNPPVASTLAQPTKPLGWIPKPEPEIPEQTIGALPRGQAMAPPPEAAWRKSLDPAIAFTGGVTKGAVQPFIGKRLTESGLSAINPNFEQTAAEHPILSGAGEMLGSGVGIGASMGLFPSAVPTAAREMLGFGAFEAARQEDPQAFVEGAGIGLGFGIGLPVLGKAPKLVKRAAQGEGRSIAEKFGIKYNGIQTGSRNIPGIPDTYVFTDPVTRSTFQVADLADVPSALQARREVFAKAAMEKLGTPGPAGDFAPPRELVKSEAQAFPEQAAAKAEPPAIPRMELSVEVQPANAAAPTTPMVEPPAKPVAQPQVEQAIKAERKNLIEQGVPRAEAHAEAEKTVALNKAATERIRQYVDLDALPEYEREGFALNLKNARAAGMQDDAVKIADDILDNRRPATADEHAGFVDAVTRKLDDFKESKAEEARLLSAGDEQGAYIERTRRSRILDDIDKITMADEIGGREAARAMSIRNIRLNAETYDIASVLREATVAKGSRLTPDEIAALEERVATHDALEKELAELETKFQASVAENAQLKAAQLTKKIAAQERIRLKAVGARERLLVEREQIKKQLVDLGYRLNDITGVSVEGSYLIGKLAVNYIREGANTLEEVVRLVQSDFAGMTARDIYQSLLTKAPEAQAKARAGAEKQISQIKRQAKLLLDIENAEKGVFETTDRKPIPQPEPIRTLQKRLRDLRAEAYKSTLDGAKLSRALRSIDELQDMLANQYRAVKKGKPVEAPELKTARDKIKQIRTAMHTEDVLADLNEQIRTGDFKIKEKPRAKELPPELERKQAEVSLKRKAIRSAVREMAPMTPGRAFGEAISAGRTMMTIGDMSAVGRQNLILLSRRILIDPAGLTDDFLKSVKATFSQISDEAINNSIKNDPQHYLRQRAGLEITEGSGPLGAREELYRGRLLERVPGLRNLVGASERQFRTFSNLMRADAFDRFLEATPNATTEEMKAWANAVNIFSGRGDLGKAAGAADALGTVIFAPKFSWSRIQTPYTMASTFMRYPRLRKEVAANLVSTLGLGTTILTLAHLSGLEVGIDPRESDWGKIKIGNTRVDIWGGFQQPMRLIARIGLIGPDRAGITGRPDSPIFAHRGKIPDVDPLELIGRFSAYKAAPTVTLAKSLLTGKSMVGEKVSPTQALADGLVPLLFQDIRDAYKDAGVGRAAAVGGLGFFGVGVNTYGKKGKGASPLPPLRIPPQPQVPVPSGP